MTIWESMNTVRGELLVTATMLIMLYMGFLSMSFYRLGKTKKNTVISFSIFVLYFAAFYMMMDGKFHYVEPDYYYYMDVDYLRTWPWVTMAFCSLPAIFVVIALMITTIYLVWGTWYCIHLRRENLTRSSIKEALDMLPAGIAFAKMNGDVVFANLSMNAIAEKRFNKNMTDISGFENNSVYSDGTKTWQFTRETINCVGNEYIQLSANDITEKAKINDELKAKNKKLIEIRNRLEIYNRRAEQITISRELLNARRLVHSETGHILLASRHYMEHPETIDEDGFLNTLKYTNTHLLKEYEEDDTEVDQLTEAVEMAKAISVRVKLQGRFLEEGKYRDILASAVNECATNIKKHTDGDTLTVITEETDNEIIFIITGNGEPLQKEDISSGTFSDNTIRETGGLASLRTLVENAGGTMEIKAEDTFSVKIKLKMVHEGDVN